MRDEMPKAKRTFYTVVVKRLLDIILSGLAIVILSPLLLILSVLELIYHGRPILFAQERPGLHGKIFKVYKFRSMTNARDENGDLLPEDQRATKFGRMIRRLSLDELPELFCILTGKMSIIGPRPLLVRYLPYYTDAERHRHDVRPGLTGLAQINGRNIISWEEKFAWDIKYIESISFFGDARIIFATIGKVFKRSDIQVGSEHRAGRLDVSRSKGRE